MTDLVEVRLVLEVRMMTDEELDEQGAGDLGFGPEDGVDYGDADAIAEGLAGLLTGDLADEVLAGSNAFVKIIAVRNAEANLVGEAESA